MEAHGIDAEPLVADLSDPKDLRMVEQRLAAGPAIDMLVNNAGYGAYSPFLELDPEVAEDMIRLQVIAPTRLTRAALPGMVARGHGAIINVSSLLGFSAPRPGAAPGPRRAMYGATKAYINSFTELVYHELEGTGVQMQVLCPGPVKTEFHERMGLPEPAIRQMPVEEVVEASLTGLRLGEIICAPAIDDPDLVRRFQEDSLRIADYARINILADRYRE
jgi:short-subunit dehydrogenase